MEEIHRRGDLLEERVSELLRRQGRRALTKHSGARRAWLQIEHSGGRLIMIIGDDGTGGADPAAGGGMRGIERRLAAFDGTMAVTSPRAEGRSNAAIAAKLFVTEKAIGEHTSNIFGKLGLPPSEDDNRRVLAVLAYLGG